MDLPLEDVGKREMDGWRFQATVDREHDRPHPFTLTATGPEDRTFTVLDGRTNPGTGWRHPWLEARYAVPPGVEGDKPGEAGGWEARFFSEVLGPCLVPGAYMMISCDGHPESLSELTVGVPPPATHLGRLLWQAGARWYKVWYYPEGWREGHEKLQGNLPAGGEHRAKREAEHAQALSAFLESEQATEHPACAQRAQAVLEQLSATG